MTRDRKFELIDKFQHTDDDKILEEAVTLYKEALDEDPTNSELLLYYGWLLEAKGRMLLQKAANYFTEGIKNHSVPNSSIEHKLNYQLIQVRAQLFQNNQSVEFYKQRLSERPDDPQMYCYLFQCYSHADQIQEMKKVLDAGLNLFPDHGLLNYLAGTVLAREGNVEKALNSWEKAIQLDPEWLDSRLSRASLLESDQRLQEAAQEWCLIIEWLQNRGFFTDGPKAELQRIEEKLNSGH